MSKKVKNVFVDPEDWDVEFALPMKFNLTLF